jgi:hypothetical protein
MKHLDYLLITVFSLFLSVPAFSQWFNDDMGAPPAVATPTPTWVNTSSACNPTGITNQGVTASGSNGAAERFGEYYDWLNTSQPNTGNATFTYSILVGAGHSANITSIQFIARKLTNGPPNLSVSVNGTPGTVNPLSLPNNSDNNITVTVSPAVTVTSGNTITVVITFSGGTTTATSWRARLNNFQIFGSVLPVELTDFSVKPSPVGFDLNWVTASENNNDYFSVERSTDGRTFASIGQVKGAGTTTEKQAYTFTDKNPLKGYNYYRLKQVDYDGNSEYSPVRSVRTGTKSSAILSPNPVQQGNNASLIVDSSTENDLTIEVFNALSQVVVQQQTTVSKGVNPIQLELLALPKGAYTLHTRVGIESGQNQQFVIQ